METLVLTGRGFAGRSARLAILAGLACAMPALSGCNEKNRYAAPPPAKVAVASPIQRPVTLYAEFTGNTAPLAAVDVEARVQGFLTAIGYRDGEAVRKDRVLFEIERDQYQAQFDLQQAQVESAKAKQVNSKREYDRQVTLGQKDVSTQRAVDEATMNYEMANAQLAANEASLRLAQTSLGYTTVRAPFDGVVTRHLAEVGSLVGQSGPTKLATVLQVNPIHVYFNISEQQQIDMRDALAKQGKTLRDLREKAEERSVEVALAADAAFQYKGKIDYIAPQLDPNTGTLQLRGVFENKDIALVPGLFVRVRVPVGKIENALLVNDTAVMSNQAGSYVMVVGEDKVVAQRQVTTGPVEGQLRVITGGLKADDKVVIGSIQRAVAGNTVDPVAGTMAAAGQGSTPAPASPVPAAGSGRSLQ
ncbi:hemolysin secretion protein D [Bradyrhizobium sp. CCBAU 25338]|jgi:multidrug efflux system membrane fusion protein|nr:hemolysin secretion protein D [Bradyrhizobium sp. CCBAU 25338]